jgi:hypothetical protein
MARAGATSRRSTQSCPVPWAAPARRLPGIGRREEEPTERGPGDERGERKGDPGLEGRAHGCPSLTSAEAGVQPRRVSSTSRVQCLRSLPAARDTFHHVRRTQHGPAASRRRSSSSTASRVAPADGGTVPVTNPATGEIFFQAPAASPADVDKAVHAARRAFESGPWSRMNPRGPREADSQARRGALGAPGGIRPGRLAGERQDLQGGHPRRRRAGQRDPGLTPPSGRTSSPGRSSRWMATSTPTCSASRSASWRRSCPGTTPPAWPAGSWGPRSPPGAPSSSSPAS